MTPQVSAQAPVGGSIPGVELGPAQGLGAPSHTEVPAPTSVSTEAVPAPSSENIPLPDQEDFLADNQLCEQILLATEDAGVPNLFHFTKLASLACAECPPLAEDNLPLAHEPLECADHQAFFLEVPLTKVDFFAVWVIR